jgi:hypothetical protein
MLVVSNLAGAGSAYLCENVAQSLRVSIELFGLWASSW